nr:hypothetical protein [uncultured Bacillus sp.]
MKKADVARGQTISFRIPSDTPDHLVKQLQRLKETERRNFSSKIAEFVLEGVSQSYTRERETITIPLPQKLTKAQRDWLKYEHSEALIGSILYHLISDPIRATSLLASLNSSSLNIDEALYVQEQGAVGKGLAESAAGQQGQERAELLSYDMRDQETLEDDLAAINWENTIIEVPKPKNVDDISGEIDLEDPLGDFLASMNK